MPTIYPNIPNIRPNRQNDLDSSRQNSSHTDVVEQPSTSNVSDQRVSTPNYSITAKILSELGTRLTPVTNFLSADIRTGVQASGDAPALSRLRSHGIQQGDDRTISLYSIDISLNNARTALTPIRAEHEDLWKRLTGQLDELEKQVLTLKTDTNPNKNKAAMIALNLATLPMNWLINMDVMGIGREDRKVGRQGTVITTGKQVRTVAQSIGMARAPTMNKDTVKDLFMRRMAFDTAKFALNVLPRSIPKLRNDETVKQPAFIGVSTVVSGAILVAGQMPEQAGFLYNAVKTLPNVISGKNNRKPELYPKLRAQSESIERHERSALNEAKQITDLVAREFQTARNLLSDEYKLSKTVNGQLRGAANAASKMSKEISVALRENEGSGPLKNEDKLFKYTLFTLGTAVLAANTYFSLNDKPNLGGEIANTLLTSALLLSKAMDPASKSSDARDTFNDFVGLVVITAIIFGADTIGTATAEEPDGGSRFLKDDGWLIATSALTAVVGNTVPGIAGQALSGLVQGTFDLGNGALKMMQRAISGGGEPNQTTPNNVPDSNSDIPSTEIEEIDITGESHASNNIEQDLQEIQRQVGQEFIQRAENNDTGQEK